MISQSINDVVSDDPNASKKNGAGSPTLSDASQENVLKLLTQKKGERSRVGGNKSKKTRNPVLSHATSRAGKINFSNTQIMANLSLTTMNTQSKIGFLNFVRNSAEQKHRQFERRVEKADILEYASMVRRDKFEMFKKARKELQQSMQTAEKKNAEIGSDRLKIANGLHGVGYAGFQSMKQRNEKVSNQNWRPPVALSSSKVYPSAFPSLSTSKKGSASQNCKVTGFEKQLKHLKKHIPLQDVELASPTADFSMMPFQFQQ